MVFLTNIPTQTEHRNKEFVARYVSLKGWESGKTSKIVKPSLMG